MTAGAHGGERPAAAREHADERELRRAGEHQHRHDARLRGAQPGGDREHAERDAVDACRSPMLAAPLITPLRIVVTVLMRSRVAGRRPLLYSLK